MGRLREWRTAELRVLRGQAAVALAAAVVLVALSLWLPLPLEAGEYGLDVAGTLASLQTAAAGVAADLDLALTTTLDTAPSPPLLLLAALAPALLLGNLALARQGGRA
jgi:hypothetical protein